MMASQMTLEQKFKKLLNTKLAPQNSRPKIQRVAKYLRKRENFEKHYTPKFVSIGPIHHGNENLKLGEEYKLMWAAQYIEKFKLNPHILHKKIADNIDELKGLFADDVLTVTGTKESVEGFTSLDEEKLSWMLFVDGCSLLHLLENADFRKLLENADFRKLEHVNNIKFDQLILVMTDIVFLENQLPCLVLKLLWKNNNETELINTMTGFLKWHLEITPEKETKLKDTMKKTWRSNCFSVQKKNEKKKEVQKEEEEEEHSVSMPNESESELPIHLLHLYRKIMLPEPSSKTKSNEANNRNQDQESQWSNNGQMITCRNIQDLKAVGIKLELRRTQNPTDITFSKGWFTAKLTLPEIIVDSTTTAMFLNLIAYEMCPDFDTDYEISSFVSFLNTLIDYPEDVRELRSKGILLNALGSDEEVANLFNIISKDVVETLTYYKVNCNIDKYYKSKFKTWIALGIHTYFSNPWAIVAFLAACIVLALTLVQTWFTINPTDK